MSFLRKLFGSAPPKESRSEAVAIYLDADLKKSIEARDQLVREYEAESNFDEDQFLYLLIVGRKGGEVLLKRRLNGFERLGECTRVGEGRAAGQEPRAFVVVGQGAERSTIPRIASQVPAADNLKFMRSGTLSRYNDAKNAFEECQLKLHHDYLTFYKFRETGRAEGVVRAAGELGGGGGQREEEHVQRQGQVQLHRLPHQFQGGHVRLVVGGSRRLYAITEAIKIRNSQIYMNDMEERLAKAMRANLAAYLGKCATLKDHSRILPLDDIGRRALRAHFRAHPVPPAHLALLSLIDAYLHMCRTRRERGEAHSEQVLEQIRRSMEEMRADFPAEVVVRDLGCKNEFVKTIEEIMKFLDHRYRREVIEKKNVHAVFQNYLLEQYRQERTLPLKTLFGADPN